MFSTESLEVGNENFYKMHPLFIWTEDEWIGNGVVPSLPVSYEVMKEKQDTKGLRLGYRALSLRPLLWRKYP